MAARHTASGCAAPIRVQCAGRGSSAPDADMQAEGGVTMRKKQERGDMKIDEGKFETAFRMALSIGNGNTENTVRIFGDICRRVTDARQKHPVFSEGAFHALGVIEAEFRELEYAIEHESVDRQMDEALDVVATCIRFLNREYER